MVLFASSRLVSFLLTYIDVFYFFRTLSCNTWTLITSHPSSMHISFIHTARIALEHTHLLRTIFYRTWHAFSRPGLELNLSHSAKDVGIINIFLCKLPPAAKPSDTVNRGMNPEPY